MKRRFITRHAEPRQEVGDPCSDCGTPLALCIQCGVDSRCLKCNPYQRPSATRHALARALRAYPEAGLLAGTILALVPAALIWAGMAFTTGLTRDLSTLTGSAAAGAYLAMGAALRKLPLPGELPTCKLDSRTAAERWEDTGHIALVAQVALVCLGTATN